MPLKIDTSKMSEEEKIEMQRLQQKRAKKLAKLNKVRWSVELDPEGML